MADNPRPLQVLSDGTQVQKVVTVDIDGNIVTPDDVTVSIEGANDSAKNTLSSSATSAELFAANSTRNHVVIRNGTNQLADVRLGATDAVSGAEAIQIPAGQTITITQWEGAIQVIFALAGSGTLFAEQTFIT